MNKHKLSLEIFEVLKKMYEFAETAQYKSEFSKGDIDFIALLLDKLNQITNQYKFLVSPEFQQFIAQFKAENASETNPKFETDSILEAKSNIHVEELKPIEEVIQKDNLEETEVLLSTPIKPEIVLNEVSKVEEDNMDAIEEQLNILEHDEEMLELEKFIEQEEAKTESEIKHSEKEQKSLGQEEFLKQNDINSKMADNQTNSINDISAGKSKSESLSVKLQKQALTDLSKAIGLNERFMFTKSLFKSDVMAYGQAISKLNSIDNLQDAENYLHNELSKKYNWNEDSKEVIQFFDLIQSRYQ
jgi:hypothetical protein